MKVRTYLLHRSPFIISQHSHPRKGHCAAAARNRGRRSHFILTITRARRPLRAWNTTEFFAPGCPAVPQPQCVWRSKLNFPRRGQALAKNTPAVPATTANVAILCQSMLLTYPLAASAQILSVIFPRAPSSNVVHLPPVRALFQQLLAHDRTDCLGWHSWFIVPLGVPALWQRWKPCLTEFFKRTLETSLPDAK